MFLSLGGMLFWKKRWLNGIVILQLSLSLVIANLVLGYSNRIARPDTMTEWLEDAAFFMPIRMGSHTDLKIDEELLRREGATLEFLPKITEGQGVRIFCYGKRTARSLKVQVTDGQWLGETMNGDAVDCVVIGNRYQIGDTFTERIGAKSFSFRIVGRMGRSATVISPSRGSSEMRAEMLFDEYNAVKQGTAIICVSDDVAQAAGTYGHALVFDATPVVRAHLSCTGKCLTMAEIRNNSEQEISALTAVFLPLAICFGLLGLISATVMACLNILQNQKVLDVYFVCGMTRKDRWRLSLGYMLWLIGGVLAATVVWFVMSRLTGLVDESNYRFGINQLIVSAAYLLLIGMVGTIGGMVAAGPTNVLR